MTSGRESSMQCYEEEKKQSEGKGAYKTEGTCPRHLLCILLIAHGCLRVTERIQFR